MIVYNGIVAELLDDILTLKQKERDKGNVSNFYCVQRIQVWQVAELKH